MSTANPLTEIRFRIPFDAIQAEHVEPTIDELLAEAQQRLDALVSSPVERTFDNTMLELERVTEKLSFAMGVVGHLESVRTTPALRKAYNAVQPKISAFYSSIPLNEQLWEQLKRFAAGGEANPARGIKLGGGFRGHFALKTRRQAARIQSS